MLLCRRRHIVQVLTIFLVSIYLWTLTGAAIDDIKRMMFKTKSTEEESLSFHIPDNYLCEACIAVAYSLDVSFQHYNDTHKKTKLTESILMDEIEKLCSNEPYWEQYGLKEVDGAKRFDGPGLEADSMWGLKMDADFWPYRMMNLCWTITSEYEEMDLWHLFQGRKLNETLCFTKEKYCKKLRIKTEL